MEVVICVSSSVGAATSADQPGGGGLDPAPGLGHVDRQALAVADHLRAGHPDVSDRGPGIDEHLERRLFQIGTGDGSTHAGAGIALSLSREFIEAMGGMIYIKETGPQGSTFAYTLPVSGSSIHQ